MDYHIYHMFPELLNLYSDRGNIITLSFFAKELGLNPIVHEINDVKDIDWDKMDFMLIGGGTFKEQLLVTSYLSEIKEKLKEEIDNGLPVLAVCGGYHFLGNYYIDSEGNEIEGLEVLDMHTRDISKFFDEDKFLNSILGKTLVVCYNESVLKKFDNENAEIMGFVSHNVETIFDKKEDEEKLMTLGDIVYGYGNDLETEEEGVFYNNLIGTNLYGPLLPKNPMITLFYLKLFLDKNELEYDFKKLDLSLETKAFTSQLEVMMNE